MKDLNDQLDRCLVDARRRTEAIPALSETQAMRVARECQEQEQPQRKSVGWIERIFGT